MFGLMIQIHLQEKEFSGIKDRWRMEGKWRLKEREGKRRLEEMEWEKSLPGKAWTRMKMLSTPTARTRKGMTSTMINVAGTPRKRKNPRDETTERRTTNTPTRPRVKSCINQDGGAVINVTQCQEDVNEHDEVGYSNRNNIRLWLTIQFIFDRSFSLVCNDQIWMITCVIVHEIQKSLLPCHCIQNSCPLHCNYWPERLGWVLWLRCILYHWILQEPLLDKEEERIQIAYIPLQKLRLDFCIQTEITFQLVQANQFQWVCLIQKVRHHFPDRPRGKERI